MVIIGVIAAITVPTLINKTKNQETVVKLKKTYSTLAQATNLIIAEEGPATNWVTNTTDVYNLYRKHLNKAMDCNIEQGCLRQGAYKNLNDNGTWNFEDNSIKYPKLVLTDGTQIIIEKAWFSQNCNLRTNGSNDFCTYIVADLNGAKKPNTFGRDVFYFVIKKNGLYPMGCDYDYCVNTFGGGCACKVLREEAINY